MSSLNCNEKPQEKMMEFQLKNPNAYDGRFPNFREPTEIGYFSLDGDRKYHNDNHQLKYICLPATSSNLYMDLNLDSSSAIKKEYGQSEKLDALLTWILYHQAKVQKKFQHPVTEELDIDFICYRGLLTQICGTIYENSDDWIICATKYKSVIYLCGFDTDKKILERETQTTHQKTMCSWGYKFEQYMTSDSPMSSPNLTSPVNEREEYSIVVKGRLKNHTLLYGAEVDGKDQNYLSHPENDPNSTKSYMELKTSRMITSDRQHRNFCRYKLLKWWLQSFLVGIPNIVCGFRDDLGIVRNLGIYPVRHIPKMVEKAWSPAVCLNFGSQFLEFVRTCVVKDDPHVVYKFYWKPGSAITCEELKEPEDYQILPDWYLSKLKI